MYAAYGGHTPDALPASYPHDVFFDDLSTQMAITQAARRLSRGSGGQQRSGTAMRISKPNSASNSPRSSTMSSRRRTMMGGDAWTARRQQQVLDYLAIPQNIDAVPSRKQSSRPLSWHPSSYNLSTPQQAFLQQQQQHHQQAGFPFPTPSMYGAADSQDIYGSQAQFSPMMTSYSNGTSPSSTFSPLPLFPPSESAQFVQSEGWETSQRSGHLYSGNDSQGTSEPFPIPGSSSNTKGTNAHGLDWNTFIMQGFNSTTPPTPDTFSQVQQQPAVSEATLPYEPLDELEDDGEILVGMGLYDTPDKFNEDPQLNNYRSTVSSLLGSSYRPLEPQGKGLKLEETWEPPKAEDEEDEEEVDDDDEEGGGEDEEGDDD